MTVNAENILKCIISSVAICATLVVNGQLTLTTTQVDILCNGANTGAIDLTVSGGVTPYSYQWSTGSQTEDLSNLAAGNYSAVVHDAAGDSANASVVIAEPTVIVATAGIDHIFCSGDSASLDVSITGGVAPYNYLWLCNSPDCFLDDNTFQNPVAKPIQTRTYYVFATDANGCSSQIDSLQVIVNQTPNLTITNDLTLTLGDEAPLVVLPGYHAMYNWQPDTFLNNNTIYSPTASPDQDITYYVTVTSDSGCMATDSVRITVVPVPVPDDHTVNNLFTPNGDGANDYWSIYPKENQRVDVVVFNRWGKEVYSQQNYQNDWDGTSNGDALPEATYYYVITIEGESEKLSGPVSIVRLK